MRRLVPRWSAGVSPAVQWPTRRGSCLAAGDDCGLTFTFQAGAGGGTSKLRGAKATWRGDLHN